MVDTTASHYKVRSGQENRVLWVFSALLTLGILVFDLSIPLGVAGGVPYVAVVLTSFWLPNARSTYIIAIICVGLTMAGFFLSPPGGELWKVLLNRGLAIFAIGVSALCVQAMRNEGILRKSHERFTDIQEMAHIGNFERDLRTDEAWWSDEVYRILGIAIQDCKPSFDRLLNCAHPEDVESLKQVRSRSTYTNDTMDVDYRILRPDGEVRILHSRIKTQLDRTGNPIRWIGTVMDVTKQKQAEEKALKYRRQLQSLASQLSLTEERERRHIGTELHDSIGQTLAVSKMKLGVLRGNSLSGTVARLSQELDELIGHAILDTRSLMFELSPPTLYELGIGPTLEWLAEQTQRKHGIVCQFKNDQKLRKPLNDDISVVLYQSVRELLRNAVRHGQASHVKISLWEKDSGMKILVEDDGVGFDLSKIPTLPSAEGGFGLFNIRERLEALGGQLLILSGPMKGTLATLLLPPKLEKG